MNKKYNFFEIQDTIKQAWLDNKTFECLYNTDKKKFVIDTPPPTVSGKLHIGHVFSYIHQDVIARYKRMTGCDVIFPFGFDNNGLPTERYIEKQYGVSSKKMTPADFIAFCQEKIQVVQNGFIELWQALGLSYDWNLVYSTISPEVVRLSQKLFLDLYKKGVVYKKKEPALFCTAFQTSISQADLEEIEKKSTMNTIIFYEVASHAPIYIATTRPELLAGCVAVFVHPDDERYKHFIGKQAVVPLYNHIVPIIADESVIIDKGTGAVLCATFGDSLDVHWFKKYNLPYRKVINNNGTLTELTQFLEHMKVEEARVLIISLLQQNSLLVEQKDIVHRVAIYERSKKEIEYVMLDQWFISILPYKKDFLDIADKIKWYPEHMKIRYIDWVKNLSWDWCISRQRTFGVPFPVWYDVDGTIILADEETLPVDPRSDQPSFVRGGSYIPDYDVMDTWNTSSLTPFIIQEIVKKQYGINIEQPLSIRPQSHDIIRTWAFDTIVKSYFLNNDIPWDSIVISGHVITNDKEKISKSKDNSPLDPVLLLQQYPADVIRYWSATAKLGIDTVFCPTKFKNGNKLIIKLWNASIFLFQDYDFSASLDVLPYCSLSITRYIVDRFCNVSNQYHRLFEEFDFSGALEAVESLFWFFCDYYVEIMKLYDIDHIHYREVRDVGLYLFYNIITLFAPFMPFMTDYIFTHFYKQTGSIHQRLFVMGVNNTDPDVFIPLLFTVIDRIRKAKSDKQVSLKTHIKVCQIMVTDQTAADYLKQEDVWFIIQKIAHAEMCEVRLQNEILIHDADFMWNDGDELAIFL
jgi:valyl-tRNA synthetase